MKWEVHETVRTHNYMSVRFLIITVGLRFILHLLSSKLIYIHHWIVQSFIHDSQKELWRSLWELYYFVVLLYYFLLRKIVPENFPRENGAKEQLSWGKLIWDQTENVVAEGGNTAITLQSMDTHI